MNKFTAFSEIQHYRAYIRGAERFYTKEDYIENINDDLIRYAGEKIKISEFRKSLHYLISECEGLLYNEMLYIYSKDLSEQVNISSLINQTNERARDYSFRNHPNNTLAAYEDFLFSRFINPTTELDKKFSDRIGESKRILPIRTQEWLRVKTRFIKAFALLIHFSSGAPIRGSEILTILFQNSSTLMRGVFIDKNLKKIIIKSRYTKTGSAISRDNPTIRILSTRINQILIHYLVIGLPFYQYLMNQQFKTNGKTYHISDVLFENNAEPINKNMINHALNRHFRIHLRTKIGVLDWRHSAKYIIKVRIIRVNPNIVLPSDSESSNKDGEGSRSKL